MELHYLEIFNTVSRLESYRKASDEMHISQPALSTEIKRLEGQIGLKLFDRVGNRVVLNQNGKLLQHYTKQIFSVVADMNIAIEEKKNHIGGTLRIGASNTPGAYIMPIIMAKFCREYPDILCNLSVGNTSEIADSISGGTLDIAVNGGTCNYEKKIFSEVIYMDKLVLVAAPYNKLAGNRLAGKRFVTRKELDKCGFIVHKADSQLYTYYEKFIRLADVAPRINMMIGSIDAMKNAVKADIGIALLPVAAVKNDLKAGSLVKLDVGIPEMDYPYSLIYNKDKVLNAADVRFADFLKQEILS